MDIHLISHIKEFKGHYLVISGIYSDKTISILNRSLNIIKEFKISSISVWGADFHISESESKVLISIYSTHTNKLTNWKYQSFNTHWFELRQVNSEFFFDHIETWEKSDIRRIKTVQTENSRHWIALRDLNYQHQKERKGKKSIINYERSPLELEIPKLNSSVLSTEHLDHNFDLLVNKDELYLSTISIGAPDKCGLIRLNLENETTLIQYFKVPLRKLHHYLSTRIVKNENKIFAYYWTTSHESSKKYQFEIYQTQNLNQSALSNQTERLVNSDFTYGIIWNKPNIISYRKEKDSEVKIVSELNSDGRINNERTIENWFPIHIGIDNDLICVSKDQKELKLINENSW